MPRGYDLYVLGVQEGLSDRVFEAVAAWTDTFRMPLHTKFHSASVPAGVVPPGTAAADTVSSGNSAMPSRMERKAGRAICVQQFMDEMAVGIFPDTHVSTVDMLDRVWGRGDGALMRPKFTATAVLVSPVVAPYTRLLGCFRHSFGAAEGSKGGVGVALGCYDVTLAFINTHMASKKRCVRPGGGRWRGARCVWEARCTSHRTSHQPTRCSPTHHIFSAPTHPPPPLFSTVISASVSTASSWTAWARTWAAAATA